MIKRLKDCKPTLTDLFKAVDTEGDGNEEISIDEFKKLATRMGINLSDHRCYEIFASVQPELAKQKSKE